MNQVYSEADNMTGLLKIVNKMFFTIQFLLFVFKQFDVVYFLVRINAQCFFAENFVKFLGQWVLKL